MSYRLEAAAARAGVTEPAARRYDELGLVGEDGSGAFSDSDVRRMQVLDLLERSGIPVDDLADLAKKGGVSLELWTQPASTSSHL